MTYDPSRHRRRSIRLRGYDYAQAGASYATICAHDRRCLFDQMVEAEMRPNRFGQVATRCWDAIPHHSPNVDLDSFVVMPNHLHGIVLIIDDAADDPGTARRAPTAERFGKPVAGSLGTVVRSFKSAVSAEINRLRGGPGDAVWQRGFYEHVVRNDRELDRFRAYMAANPSRWPTDALHPDNPSRW